MLRQLRNSTDFIVFPTDKNLGPAILERPEYVRRALSDHLLEATTYRRLTEAQAQTAIHEIRGMIRSFIRKFAPSEEAASDAESLATSHQVTRQDKKYILRALDATEDPYSHFYITAKIHKTPWKTRPIVSVCGSIVHGLARWLDQQLQPLAQRVPSYIKSSFDLKTQLLESDIDWRRARFFTLDAVSMYTNIDTEHALSVIANFLQHHPLCHDVSNREAIMSALELIMRNNVFRFGDTYWRQLCGTAMGTPPGCSYATLYYAIHELEFYNRFRAQLPFYKRYIDDGIALWYSHPDPAVDAQLWNDFKNVLPYGKLEWDVFERSTTVDFLDLTLTIENGQVSFRVYEKPENLYLYLPPHSAHPPGMSRALITGQIKRYVRLSSSSADCIRSIRTFYRRLCMRGHHPDKIKPIFISAYQDAIATPPPVDESIPSYIREYLEDDDSDQRVFLHLNYNPADPPRHAFQRVFRETILHPEGEPPLYEVRNIDNKPIEIRRCTIAYHRPSNLRGLLFQRRFREAPDQPVSSFITNSSL